MALELERCISMDFEVCICASRSKTNGPSKGKLVLLGKAIAARRAR